MYIERQFAFRQLVAGVRDTRRRPQIATATVWLCVFAMFALRLRSFNALGRRRDLCRRRRSIQVPLPDG